jgi:hypothetical protein
VLPTGAGSRLISWSAQQRSGAATAARSTASVSWVIARAVGWGIDYEPQVLANGLTERFNGPLLNPPVRDKWGGQGSPLTRDITTS